MNRNAERADPMELLADDLYTAKMEIIKNRKHPDARPDLYIYMRRDFYIKCMSQSGRVSSDVFYFIDSRKDSDGQRFMGERVYVVDSENHPEYAIVVNARSI